MIAVKGITKTYGKHIVLDSVTLELREGSIAVLLGPNGSGKSTLIRVLAGRTKQDSGDVQYNNEKVSTEETSWQSRLGIVNEENSTLPYLNIEEHLYFHGSLYKMEYTGLKDKAKYFLNRYDLWDDRTKTAKAGSLGMRKKLAFILGILHSPGILLLDEPFTALDPPSVLKMKQDLLYLKAYGSIILLITHRLDAAAELADSGYYLEDGRIASSWTAAKSASELEGYFLRTQMNL